MKSGNYFKGVRKAATVLYVIDYWAWLKQIMVWLVLVLIVVAVYEDQIVGAHRAD